MCMPFLGSNSEVVTMLALIFIWFLIGLLLGMRILKGRSAGGAARSNSGGGGGGGGSRRPAPKMAASAGSVEIYVGNLAYDISDDDLRKMFEEHGRVESVRVITNKFNGKSKGYGFVNMADSAGAQDAIQALHGKDIKGRELVVNEAKSKSKGRDDRGDR